MHRGSHDRPHSSGLSSQGSSMRMRQRRTAITSALLLGASFVGAPAFAPAADAATNTRAAATSTSAGNGTIQPAADLGRSVRLWQGTVVDRAPLPAALQLD